MAETACASVLQAHGDDTEAFRRYMAAAEAFERMGQRYEAARCFLWAAGIRGVETQGVDARSLVERALLIFRDLGVVTAERQARQQLKQK
jgi:hypothetical protein